MPTFLEPISLTAATAVLTAKAHAGCELFMNRAGGITITLPAPDAGLRFRFIVGTAPTTAYTINSNGGANIIVVSVNELETDTSDDGPYDDDADIVSFVASIAAVGDFLDLYCDGTKWYGRGQTNLDGAITSGTT